MHPILFSLPLFSHSIDIYAYPVFLIFAGLVVIGGTIRFAKIRNLPMRSIAWMLFAMLMAALVGARMLHILVNFGAYAKNPSLIYSFDDSGFSLFGGVIFAVITGYVMCRMSKVNFWKFADTITPFLGIGIAMVRIGCFLNGCCFGKITSLPWGVTFPFFSEAHKYQMSQSQTTLLTVRPVHPTQIYELLAALTGSLLAMYVIKRKTTNGTAALVFALWFTVFRWIDYYFMVQLPTFQASPYFYPFLYFGLILVCLFFLLRKSYPNL